MTPRLDTGKVVMALPRPDSPNQSPPPQWGGARTAWKTEQKRQAFRAALEDCPPVSDPPSPVLFKALYRIPNRNYEWDDDNMTGALKWVLDALKVPKTESNDPLTYRDGLFLDKGWIVDDDPPHCILDRVNQEVYPEREDPDLVVNIVPIREEEGDGSDG